MTKGFYTLAILAAAFACGAALSPALAQEPAVQPLYLVYHPTAGLLDHGAYLIRGLAGAESSLLGQLGVGFKNLFQVGASFGMQNVLGYGSLELNDKIGLQARVRLIEESDAPALAIGFNSQGLGVYHEELERYDRKSVGFYVVVSKNWMFALGDISAHGGVSLSTERTDDDDPNLFVGADWTILKRLAFILDLDAALNDNARDSEFGQGGIYLDAGIRWFYGESLLMTLIFQDLTGNFGGSNRVGRAFEFAFINSF
ncbi:MAG: hypothetical protein JSW50_11785 [Candidatus Latescibacterota bacterium]|nr:MAG: hypothetical protein JSW50_11785 [Candidatus Latescibacterota bacterium]